MNAMKELERIRRNHLRNLQPMDQMMLGAAMIELERRFESDPEGFAKDYGTRLVEWVTDEDIDFNMSQTYKDTP